MRDISRRHMMSGVLLALVGGTLAGSLGEWPGPPRLAATVMAYALLFRALLGADRSVQTAGLGLLFGLALHGFGHAWV